MLSECQQGARLPPASFCVSSYAQSMLFWHLVCARNSITESATLSLFCAWYVSSLKMSHCTCLFCVLIGDAKIRPVSLASRLTRWPAYVLCLQPTWTMNSFSSPCGFVSVSWRRQRFETWTWTGKPAVCAARCVWGPHRELRVRGQQAVAGARLGPRGDSPRPLGVAYPWPWPPGTRASR